VYLDRFLCRSVAMKFSLRRSLASNGLGGATQT
jgi:hypothetical protein